MFSCTHNLAPFYYELYLRSMFTNLYLLLSTTIFLANGYVLKSPRDGTVVPVPAGSGVPVVDPPVPVVDPGAGVQLGPIECEKGTFIHVTAATYGNIAEGCFSDKAFE